ncbi:MAG: ketopantoate reductase family protein [Dysgonamonadaceae bacterium]|jgi:2-dehydropantoate 2-reductase|nr:ketopantoate reductase family protein [Dysgonamonadaceae bacterium]
MRTKYLIIGTGGVGGSIAGFLGLAGKDVTCIARGAHLEAIQKRGLHLVSDIKGEHTVPVKACTEAEYTDKADIILVCVKGYSIDSVSDFIRKAAHSETLVIPILNGYGTGDKLEQRTGLKNILDGCIYIVGFISGAGEITQMGKVFRLIFGTRTGQTIPAERLQAIQNDWQESGIRTIISDDIRRDTFIKWAFISAMACTGAYYNVPMGALQSPGPERDTFAGLSDESTKIGRKLGIAISDNQTEKNLQIIDALAPESTASMQKDLEKGRQTEINNLLFNMIEWAEKAGVAVPVYQKVASKFRIEYAATTIPCFRSKVL